MGRPLTLLVFISGFLFGTTLSISVLSKEKSTAKEPSRKSFTNVWVELTSGWYKNYTGSTTGYAMPSDSGAYWWLVRSGRTIVEGPSKSIPDAILEVENHVKEFVVTR